MSKLFLTYAPCWYTAVTAASFTYSCQPVATTNGKHCFDRVLFCHLHSLVSALTLSPATFHQTGCLTRLMTALSCPGCLDTPWSSSAADICYSLGCDYLPGTASEAKGMPCCTRQRSVEGRGTGVTPRRRSPGILGLSGDVHPRRAAHLTDEAGGWVAPPQVVSVSL